MTEKALRNELFTTVVLEQDDDTAATSCFYVHSSCQSCYDFRAKVTNSKAKATNSKAKVTNSKAKATNSIANGTNSFANRMNSFANGTNYANLCRISIIVVSSWTNISETRKSPPYNVFLERKANL